MCQLSAGFAGDQAHAPEQGKTAYLASPLRVPCGAVEVTETFEASVQLRRNDAAPVGEVALAPDVRPGATHVRELESPLRQAMGASTVDVGGAGPLSHVPEDRLRDTGPPSQPAPGIHVPENMLSKPGPMGQANPDHARAEHDRLTIAQDVTPASLDRHEGRQEPAWRELGLSSRHVRTRLVRRDDLHLRGRGGA